MRSREKFLFCLGVLLFLSSCSSVQKNKEIEYSLLRGVNFSQQQGYEKAMSEYQKAYSLSPNNITLLKEMGYCYYQVGNYQKAEEFWLKGLNLAPKDDDIIKNLATLYYKEREYDKALNIIKNSYNPEGSYYLKLRALISYTENKNQAYELFKKLNIEEFDVESSIKYMELLKEMNKREELYYYMKNTYPSFMNNEKYIINYTQNLSNIYNLNEEAKKILLEYIARNGKDNDILLQLSALYLKDGERKKAEDIYKLMF